MNKQNGLAPILIILLIAGAVGGYLLYTNYSNNQTKSPQQITASSSAPTGNADKLTESKFVQVTPKVSLKLPPVSPTSSPVPLWANDPITKEATCGKNENSSIRPASGSAPLYVSLYPSGGVNYKYGTLVGYQWDFEGDGVWDTEIVDGVMHYTYAKPGTYTPIFRVRTSEKSWSENCSYPYKVIVDSTGSNTDPISVDRDYFEITVKKSDYVGKTYTTFDAFKVSTKDQFTFVSTRTEGLSPEGYSGESFNLEGGNSVQFHFTVNLTAAAGEYTNQIKVLYIKNNQTVEGPTVKYKINIKD